MKKQSKKESFTMPTQANQDGEFQVHGGIKENYPLDSMNKMTGESVNEHKELEAANEVIAEKEISQTYNNS
ncbi:hypothetical protein SAMN05216389_13225 [Oceanobacillus limi]|uniref:DUF4025 domain-containing protein n=1 Tax=Oceanobacillus limi TaxID=930131 RepID=A0A1I0HDH1_9BACI|nr:hypothetical protein [Oceanobacillus limi]SET81859.1 hypothetical protein SAMN05216389_13225 [Oceanobacillus limi]